jgi:phosphinothricin acetyltransferase
MYIGVGKALVAAIITLSEKANIWTIQSGIFPENKISIRLHESFEFRMIGYREKYGKMTAGVYKGIYVCDMYL